MREGGSSRETAAASLGASHHLGGTPHLSELREGTRTSVLDRFLRFVGKRKRTGPHIGLWETLGQNGEIQEKIHELTLFYYIMHDEPSRASELRNMHVIPVFRPQYFMLVFMYLPVFWGRDVQTRLAVWSLKSHKSFVLAISSFETEGKSIGVSN